MKKEHPVTYRDFLQLYYTHLSATDQPTCFIAYCRAEADVIREHGERRFANSKVFRNTMSRNHKKTKTLA